MMQDFILLLLVSIEKIGLPFSDDAPRNRFLGSLGTPGQSPIQGIK